MLHGIWCTYATGIDDDDFEMLRSSILNGIQSHKQFSINAVGWFPFPQWAVSRRFAAAVAGRPSTESGVMSWKLDSFDCKWVSEWKSSWRCWLAQLRLVAQVANAFDTSTNELAAFQHLLCYFHQDLNLRHVNQSFLRHFCTINCHDPLFILRWLKLHTRCFVMQNINAASHFYCFRTLASRLTLQFHINFNPSVIKPCFLRRFLAVGTFDSFDY